MHQQQQIRMQLSVNLIGVLSQTLVKRKDGRGRAAAHEVLVATSAVRNLIRENKSYQINSLIQTGARMKMTTLDQSLVTLVEKGLVTVEDARARAKDPGEFDRLLALGEDSFAAPAMNSVATRPTNVNQAQIAGGVRGQPNRPAFRRE
jgi:twitching motility protein PilT